MLVSVRRLVAIVLLAACIAAPAFAGEPQADQPRCTAAATNVRCLPRNLLRDQAWFWTRPTHVRAHDLPWLLSFSGITAGLIASDTAIEGHLPDSPGVITDTRQFSNAAVAALAGAAGGFYLWGRTRSDDRARETGLLSAEALAGSFGIAEAVKLATRRERPLEGDHDGSFEQGGSSFPSQHAAVAWSVAEVVAEEYPRPITRVLAYGMATAVCATRVTGRRHFSSDVFVGAALGWYMGRHVFRAHHQTDDGRFGRFLRQLPRTDQAASSR